MRLRERYERVESPGAYVTVIASRGHFCFARCSFELPFRALVVITWRGVGIVAQLLEIKAQVSSVWIKGCMLDDCVYVIRLDMTTPP